MNIKQNKSQTVVVDADYFWQPMCTAPTGKKIQLLGAGGVATYGEYQRGDSFWQGWAPLPKKPDTPH